jgi:hypothetical protein
MKILTLIPLAALACACTASDIDEPTRLGAAEPSELGRRLAGYSERETVSCVPLRQLRDSRAYGTDTVVFEGSPGTLYVNRLRSECPRVEPGYAIRHRATGTTMCSGEPITVFDATSRVEYGGCALGEFTRYQRD